MDDALSPGATLRTTWGLVRDHPVPLLAPFVLLAIASSIGPGTARTTPTSPAFALASFTLFALLFLAAAFAWLVTARGALDALATGRAPDLGSAMRAASASYGGALLVFLLAALALGVGFALLVVPGLVLLVGLSPLAAVVVAEGPQGPESLKRAWSLTKGHFAKAALGVLALVAIGVVGALVLDLVPWLGRSLSTVWSGLVMGAGAVWVAAFYQARIGSMRSTPAWAQTS